MEFLLRFSLVLFLTAGCLTFGGCDTPGSSSSSSDADDHDDHADHDDHEGHDHPETYGEAVSKIESLRDEIKAAAAAGDIEKAHGPLHEIGHMLEHIPDLAKKAGLSEEDLKAVQEAQDKVFAAFDAVDSKLHDKEGKTYDEVAEDVDAGIATLVSKKK